MKKRQVVPLLLGAAIFGTATWLYPPWVAVQEIPGSSRPAGYAWRFTGPPRMTADHDFQCSYKVDVERLAWLWSQAAIGLCLVSVGLCPELVQLDALPKSTTSWRGRLAARIPALLGGSLVLAWILPIQFFLLCTLNTRTWFPVLGLTALGLMLGHCLPASYFRLRRWEVDGRVYGLLGVRQFRNFVSNGDLALRMMRWIDPAISKGMRRLTLDQHEARRRLSERLHWSYLLGSIPAMALAVLVQKPEFAGYLLIANVFFNVMPIMLQRYTRAQLARIRAHRRFAPPGRNHGGVIPIGSVDPVKLSHGHPYLSPPPNVEAQQRRGLLMR